MRACAVQVGSMQRPAATLHPRRPSAAWRRPANTVSALNTASSQRVPAPQRGQRRVAVQAAASAAGIEAVGGVRPEIDAAVQQALDQCLTHTDLGMGKKYTASRGRGGVG